MQVSDDLVDLHVSVCRERSELADFVRSSGPVKDWNAVVRAGAARRQRSLEESERTLEDAVRGHARSEGEVRELRRSLRRAAAINFAKQGSDRVT